jgi:hypothetical protein
MGRYPYYSKLFLDDVGDNKGRVTLKHQSYFQQQVGNSINDIINQCVFTTHSVPSTYEFNNIIFYNAYDTDILVAPKSSQTLTPKTTAKRDPDFQKLRPLFDWLSTDIIQQTFQHTTQYACFPTATMLK